MSINNIKLYFWTPTFYLDYYIKEYSEKNILQYFLNKVSNTDIVWDIGANFGIYSLPLSKVVSSNGKVYAFEPEKNTFELLKKNIELNDINNIKAFQIALGNKNEKLVLFQSDTSNIGSHSFVQRTDYKLKNKGDLVDVFTGDYLVEKNNFEIPDFIKIDVEGAECLVLEGLLNILSHQKVKDVLIELHPTLIPLFGSSINYIESTFKGLGYKNKILGERGDQTHIHYYKE